MSKFSEKINAVNKNTQSIAPMIIISFVFNFMLFIYEPINMFASNSIDFSYSLKDIFFPILGMFFIGWLLSSLILTLIYFINKKIYNIITVIYAVIFFETYIQGVFLSSKLPVLNGSTIIWKNYRIYDLITIGITAVIIFAVVFIIKKFKIKKALNYISNISMAVFFILIIGSFPTFFKIAENNSNKITTTGENLNVMSENKNFIIFVVDTVDSRSFYKNLKKNNDLDFFSDFTYYPDTMSYYAYTLYSVPEMLTGIPCMDENPDIYDDYYIDSFNKSPLFESLSSNNYNINIYTSTISKYDNSKYVIQNIDQSIKPEINEKKYINSQLRYNWYKYSPYFFKKMANIETVNFDIYDNSFYSDNKWFYNLTLKNSKFDMTDKNQFKFIHTDGAHPPFVYDKNFNDVSLKEGVYENQIDCTVTMLKTYINKLKANKVYNNTTLIIMSDHGYSEKNDDKGRFNPLFMIKAPYESNNNMIISDKPISYDDLQTSFVDLINGRKTNELFDDISQNRTRKFIINFNQYETNGKAWEKDKFKQIP